MSKLKQVLKKALRQVALTQLPPALQEMKDSENPQTQALAKAIEDTFFQRLSPEEMLAIRAIESHRQHLYQSTQIVETLDYGAGSPEDQRTTEEMHQGVKAEISLATLARASKPAFWASLLYHLTKTFQPRISIELGSCVGISAAYQASALKQTQQGQIFTLEGSPVLAKQSRSTIESLGLSDYATVIEGRFQDCLPSLLENHQPIDLAFIDGHHDHAATLVYFEQFLPYLHTNSLLIFDDIRWSEGMKQAWKSVQASDKLQVTVDLGNIGLALIGTRDVKAHYSLHLNGLMQRSL